MQSDCELLPLPARTPLGMTPPTKAMVDATTAMRRAMVRGRTCRLFSRALGGPAFRSPVGDPAIRPNVIMRTTPHARNCRWHESGADGSTAHQDLTRDSGDNPPRCLHPER